MSAFAQISDLGDAINKAGRQRAQPAHGQSLAGAGARDREASAQQVLDKSLALFDRQLVELKAYSMTADIKDTYTRLRRPGTTTRPRWWVPRPHASMPRACCSSTPAC